MDGDRLKGERFDGGHAQCAGGLPTWPWHYDRQVGPPRSLVRCYEEVVMGKKTIQHHRRCSRLDLAILAFFDSGFGGCDRHHPVSSAFQENREFSRSGNLEIVQVKGHPDPEGADAGQHGLFQSAFYDFELALGDCPRVVTEPGPTNSEGLGSHHLPA